jgi:hypothetical protein
MTASGSEKGKKLGLGYWKSFLKRNEDVIRTKKPLNLTINVLIGVLTKTCKRCTRRFIKTFAVQALPANILSHCGEMKTAKSLQKKKHMG